MATSEMCRHGRRICSECVIVTDAGKRAADIINSYVTFVPWDERARAWVAIRLSDGGSDGTLYDSKRAAVRHQADEFLCAYFSFRTAMAGTTARDMQIWLDMHRHYYDRGARLPDPDDMHGGPELIMPAPREQMANQRSRLIIPGGE